LAFDVVLEGFDADEFADLSVAEDSHENGRLRVKERQKR
jgi:hypothetical protein